MPGRSALARAALLVVLPAGLFTFPTTLFLALLGLLRGSLALRSLVLALRLGCLLLMLLRGPLLWRPRLRLRLWWLRGSLGLTLRPGCLLLTLRRLLLLLLFLLLLWLLLWLGLARLRLGCRPSLVGRCLGGSRPLHLASALLLRPSAGCRGSRLRA